MEKSELRNKMKVMRKALSESEIKILSEKIFKSLSELSEYKHAKTVCVYMDAFKEIKTSLIISDCREKRKKILFPVSDKEMHTLTLCRDVGSFLKGAYGILEPAEKIIADFSEPDLIIVPGLAFDKEKNRLGFGAGYYDRLLSECQAVKIGICYDFQLIDCIKSEQHDIKMDMVLTPTRIIV